MSKEEYQRLKEKGICPTCYKPNDGKYVYCDACRERKKARRRELQAKGICPVCRTQKLYCKEKICPDCLIKSADSLRKYRSDNTEKCREYNNSRSKERIAKLKEQGLCTRCGKRKATSGFSRCEICRNKITEYSHTLDRYQGTGYSNFKYAGEKDSMKSSKELKMLTKRPSRSVKKKKKHHDMSESDSRDKKAYDFFLKPAYFMRKGD